MSPQLHDSIFAIGALILFFSMLPAVLHKSVLPLSTCLLTGAILFIFSLNYATMTYWYASVVEAGNTACWFYLLWISRRAHIRA